MKFIFLITILFFSETFPGNAFHPNLQSERPSAEYLLQQLHTQIRQWKTLRYLQHRELNYSSENYHSEQEWSVYIDFEKKNNPLGFIFQMEGENTSQVFNGTESFDLDKQQKTSSLNDHPTMELFNSASFFYNSIMYGNKTNYTPVSVKPRVK